MNTFIVTVYDKDGLWGGVRVVASGPHASARKAYGYLRVFLGDSHRTPGTRVTIVYPHLANLVREETRDWRQVPGDGLTYVRL